MIRYTHEGVCSPTPDEMTAQPDDLASMVTALRRDALKVLDVASAGSEDADEETLLLIERMQLVANRIGEVEAQMIPRLAAVGMAPLTPLVSERGALSLG